MNHTWLIGIINGTIVIVVAFILYLGVEFRKRRKLQVKGKYLLNQVQSLIQAHRYQEAMTLLDSNTLKHIKPSKLLATVAMYRGICLQGLAPNAKNPPDNLRQALDEFNTALKSLASNKTAPEKASIFKSLGLCYTALADYEAKENHLNEAKKAFESGLKNITSKSNPVAYATLNYLLGKTCYSISQLNMTIQQDCLIQAAAALNEAEKFFSPKKYPAEYGRTHLALSQTLHALAHFQDAEGNLTQAIASAHNVLEYADPAANPSQYAAALYNLGSAHLALASLKNDSSQLRRAYRFFKRALRIYNLKDQPLEFAQTQQKLIQLYQNAAKNMNSPKYLYRSLQSGEAALKIFTVDRYPLSYGSIHFHQGKTLTQLAKYENPKHHLTKALAALQETAKVYTERLYPEVYTETQTFKGQIYLELADLEPSLALEPLTMALSSFKSAIRTYRFKSEVEAARVQELLGDTHQRLADWEDAAENLAQAITAHENALVTYTQHAYPVEHVGICRKLAKSYLSLASFSDRLDNLNKALKVLESITARLSPIKDGVAYAEVFGSLGATCRELATGEDRVSNLEKAISYYEKALKVNGDLQSKPAALLQADLGLTYKTLAQEKNKLTYLERATQSFQKALKTFTPESFPEEAALALSRLGDTYVELAEVADPEFNRTKAHGCFEKASTLTHALKNPLDSAKLNYSLGRNAMSLAGFGNAADLLQQAIQAFERALEVYATDYPEEYAAVLNDLGVAYQNLGEALPHAQETYLLNSVQCLKQALQIYCVKKYPLEHAMVQNNMGTAYSLLAEKQNRDYNLSSALSSFEAAKKLYTPAAHADDLKKVTTNIEKIKSRFRMTK